MDSRRLYEYASSAGKTPKSSSLRLAFRTMAVCLAFGVLFCIATIGVFDAVLGVRIQSTERENVINVARLTRKMLDNRAQNMAEMLESRTFWQAAYDFTVNPSVNADVPAYALADPTLKETRIDVVLWADRKGRILFERGLDFAGGGYGPVPDDLKKLMLEAVPSLGNPEQQSTGYALIQGRPVILIYSPVISPETLDYAGSLLVLSYLHDGDLQTMTAFGGTSLFLADDSQPLPGAVEIPAEGIWVVQSSPRSYSFGLSAPALSGMEPFYLRGEFESSVGGAIITARGFTVKFAIISGILLFLITYMSAETAFLKPLRRLYMAVRYLASTGVRIGAPAVYGTVFKELNNEVQALANNAREAESRCHNMENEGQARSAFIRNLSRDMRHPVAEIIKNANQIMEENNLSYVAKQHCVAVRDAAGGLMDLAMTVLSFSEMESGDLVLEKAPFRLDDVLEELAENWRENWAHKNLDFIYAVPPEIPQMLVGDRFYFTQILKNLLSNAFKFTETGEVFVGCSIENRSKEEVRLHFVVRDTGIGMTPDEQSNVLIPFHLYSKGDSGRGTGLGLAITRKLAQLMGGDVEIRSVYGRGTSVIFSLTFGVVPGDGSSHWGSTAELRDVPVLILEGNSNLRLVYYDILKGWYMQVDSAESLGEGIAALREAHAEGKPFRLVLLSERLNDKLGIDVAQDIKNNLPKAAWPDMLMISEQGLYDSEISDAGIKAVLSKPVTGTALLGKLKQVIKNSRNENGTDNSSGHLEFAGCSVLVVEDNPINEQMMVDVLKGMGIEVKSARTGKEALLRMSTSRQQHPFDLILMDIQLPGMDGLTTTRHIRSKEEFANIPVIAMSANALKSDIEDYFKAGMNDFLAKPISMHSLYAVLSDFLHHCRSDNPAEDAGDRDGAVFSCAKADGGHAAESIDGEDSAIAGHGAQNDEELPELPGFNSAGALDLLNNNVKLYKNILKSFYEQYSSNYLEFATRVRNGEDSDGIQREAHTVKGLAGTIGRPALREVALSLEQLYKDKSDIPEDERKARAEAFLTELGRTLDSLKKAMDDGIL